MHIQLVDFVGSHLLTGQRLLQLLRGEARRSIESDGRQRGRIIVIHGCRLCGGFGQLDLQKKALTKQIALISSFPLNLQQSPARILDFCFLFLAAG